MERNVYYSTFQAFRPHFDALARVAYFKLVPKPTSATKHVLHSIYRVIIWIFILTGNVQVFILVVQFRHSLDEIMNMFYILLTTLSALGKQITFNLRSHEIDVIISIIDGPAFAARNHHNEQLLQANAATQRKLLRFYSVSILICGVFYGIFPLVNRALGQEVVVSGYFPFDTSNSPVFEVAVTYLAIFFSFQGYGNITMDCTIVAFYAQAKVQLQILRYNFEHLVDCNGFEKRSDKLKEHRQYESDNFKRDVQQKFIECVTRHQQIKRFISKIETTFADALLFQFCVTSLVICIAVYKIVGLNLLSAEFVTMALYLVCMLAQLFLYCYYGTQVQYESEFLIQSAYCGDWLSLSSAFRRQLLLMMENCKQPITLRIAYIIPINLETYIAVLRASYSLYTFLDRK